jgi:hypothetical protein
MAGKLTERFTVGNLDQWGRLVKSWATKLDYISQDFARQPPRGYWENKTWPSASSPGPQSNTVPETDSAGKPKLWCLPKMGPITVTVAKGPTSATSATVEVNAVALEVDEFKRLVGNAGVAITVMPGEYKHVVVVQAPDDNQVMVLRLPPKKTLQSSEDDLMLSGNDYPFALFYSHVFHGAPHPPPSADRPGVMQLHASRIGEYTLNTCS